MTIVHPNGVDKLWALFVAYGGLQGAADQVQVRLLGPIDVTVDGAVRPVAGSRRKAVLAVLGLSAGEIVPTDRLIDVVWGDKPPPTASNTLQAHVSYLRGVLGARTAIVARAPGYVLDAGTDATDLLLAERLIRQGKGAADTAQRAADLRAAVALWRGRPLAELSGQPWLEEQADRLVTMHFDTMLALIEARLALGEHAALVPELDRLTQQHPFHEPLHGQLMVALYGMGRQADALTAYQQLRRNLDDELGIEPSPALRELESAILRQDAVLLPRPAAVRATEPAPPANAAVPAQLPSPVDGFVGRAAQLDQLDAFLAGADNAGAQRGGAPTLIIAAIGGTAGVGKTSLAVHWGQRVRHRFPDGQLHVDLRGYATSPPVRPSQALAQFLHALGVPAERVPPDVDEAAAMYRTLLADRRMLIVLDNAASPDQVRPLLPGSPHCLVIVTSRDRLGGLIVSEGARLLALDVLPAGEAHALLESIVGRERTAAEPDAVAALARACGYLPLALRIAAANLAMRLSTSITGYAAELREGNRLAALRVDGDEQSAVRAAFDLSYATLKPDERCVFRRLALMPGPDANVAVAATLAGIGEAPARRILSRLVDGHLVNEPAIGRFALHDLLRLYARSLADDEDGPREIASALDRLYGHYVAATSAAADLLYRETIRLPGGQPGPASLFTDHIEALVWLDTERANIVALVHAGAAHGPRQATWQLADNLRGYFYLRRPAGDWLAIATDALRAADGHPAPQAAAHLSLGVAYNTQGNRTLAIDHFTSALALTERAGWLEGQAASLNNLGTVYSQTGNHRAAADWFTRSVDVHARAGRVNGQAIAVDNIGIVRRELGELEVAADLHRRAIELHQASGFPFGHATALMNLGAVYFDMGRVAEALACYVEAHALHRQTGNRDREAICLYGIAEVHCAAGRHDRAADLAREAIAVARDIGDRRTEANAAITLGTIYSRLGRHRAALDQHRHALRLARETDSRYIRARALIAVAGSQLELGQIAHADATVREALAVIERDGYQRLAADAGALRAQVDAAQAPPQLSVPPHALSRRNAARAAL